MSKRPGWYPDPFDASEHAGVRYWNGHHWTAEAMNRWQLESTRTALASGPAGTLTTTYAGSDPAGWWHRAAALLLDQVLATTLLFVAFGGQILEWYAAMRDTAPLVTQPGADPKVVQAGVSHLGELSLALMGPLVLGALAINVSFFVLMVALFGGSPGKLALGLRIVRADGADLGFGAALWRWIIPILLAMIPFLGGLVQIFDYLRPAWHAQKQALHDTWAGTLVVRRPRTVTVATGEGALASTA